MENFQPKQGPIGQTKDKTFYVKFSNLWIFLWANSHRDCWIFLKDTRLFLNTKVNTHKKKLCKNVNKTKLQSVGP
jgi:hypothetical protein